MDSEQIRQQLGLVLRRAVNDDGEYDAEDLEGPILDTLQAMFVGALEWTPPKKPEEYGARYRRPNTQSSQAGQYDAEIDELERQVAGLTEALASATEELAESQKALATQSQELMEMQNVAVK